MNKLPNRNAANFRRSLALALAFVLLLATTACGTSTSTTAATTTGTPSATTAATTAGTTAAATTATTAAKPLTKVRFLLDWTPNTNHTGLYVAKELGYFKDAGLDVEIVQPPEGGALSLIAAGKAEFCVSFQEEIASALTASAPLSVKAVGTIIQHNTSGIISLKDKNIVRPRDMQNHVYATWDTPIEKAILSAIVSADGGSFSKVKTVPSTVTDVVAALKAGTGIDMVWIYYAWDGIATELAGLQTNFIDFGKANAALDFYTPVIAASSDYLSKNPETARKFLAATAKGYEYAIANPKEAAAILVKNAQGVDSKLANASQEWLKDKYKAEVPQWGRFDQKRWDAFYAWMYENKLVPRKLNPGEGFSNDYLPA